MTAVSNGLDAGHPGRRFLHDIGLPFVLFYAPGVVAAVGSFLRCGAATCLVVGLIPAGVFASTAILGSVLGVPGVGGGDAPLWSITLAFATISLVAAIVGCVVGLAIRVVVARVHRRRAGRTESEGE
ncbi:hypothetical protein [Natronococcus sp. A-GB7]|uniref:hypothetical protein n=1 Tax=Natronococcus sp. A-GB7 TaxID=3037649 RepID=UPI00241D8290|nr:hypothetical protein [Natronococcus sp. A-GB7]MDG5818603.1 hypothetical protein [Natronococcus sp. A-GB7]